jgi:C4-type Zn-finger protein
MSILNPKCPSCGSTAQVRILYDFILDPAEGRMSAITYKCGCGCRFTKVFTEEFETIWEEGSNRK